MKLAVLLIPVAIMIGSCGGGEPGRSDSNSADVEKWESMQESPQFTVALEQYKACMLEGGYPETDQRIGVVLKDGSIVKPEPGSSYTLSGAYLDYVRTHEDCEDSSGINSVRQQFGTANPTPNAAVQKRTNETHLKEFGCMKDKGWDIPEPVTTRGLLIFDVKFDSAEQQSAYNLDYYRCMAELGTVNSEGQRTQ